MGLRALISSTMQSLWWAACGFHPLWVPCAPQSYPSVCSQRDAASGCTSTRVFAHRPGLSPPLPSEIISSPRSPSAQPAGRSCKAVSCSLPSASQQQGWHRSTGIPASVCVSSGCQLGQRQNKTKPNLAQPCLRISGRRGYRDRVGSGCPVSPIQ